MPFKLDFLFVGPQRTGSTWIHQKLLSHPDLFFPNDVKETFYFDRHFDKGLDWYGWHFKSARENQKKGEVGPSYFDIEEVPGRVYNLNPDCKIVITIRNPIDKAQSLFHHHLSKGRVSLDFKQAINEMPRILSAGSYGRYIPEWLNIFGRDQVKILFFDDLKEKPGLVLKETTEFLNVSSISTGDEKASKKVNEASMPKNLFLARQGARLSLFLKEKRLHKIVDLGKGLGLKKAIFGGNKSKLPLLSQNQRTELFTYYEKDIKYLEALTNRSLDEWKR